MTVPVLLRGEDLRVTYAVEGGPFRRRIGAVRALDGVSFHLSEGETLGLVGESGSGKTTLGRVIARLLRPSGGRLSWEDRPAEDFTTLEWSGRVQMVFQDPAASLNPKLPARVVLEEALAQKHRRAGGRPPARAALREEARALLGTVGLPPDALFYYPHQLSGGQKQRLAIARALAMEPRVLVADEPVSALDLSIQAQILNLLMELKDRYRLATVIVSHDLAVVGHMADRLLVMKDGAVVESGPTAGLLAAPAHPYTRALLDAVPKAFR